MLRDYRLWEAGVLERYGLTSESALRNWVEKHYAEDPDYANKLQQALRQLNDDAP